MEGESRSFRIFLALVVSIFAIIGVVYFGLLIFDAKPTVYRRVLYSFMPNFKVVEFVATLVPNPKIIEGYFLNDIVKNPTSQVSDKWVNTYSNTRIIPSTRTGISPSYHKDLVYFVGKVIRVDPEKSIVEIEVQGDRYTLNFRPYTYYYKHKDVKSLEIGKIAYFLVYDGGGILTVINLEL